MDVQRAKRVVGIVRRRLSHRLPSSPMQRGRRFLKLTRVSSYVMTSGSNYSKLGNGNDGR